MHHVIKTQYGSQPNSLTGNDDCGQMSAWYVFNALGFYPLNPVSGRYELGTPMFDRAVWHLPNGKTFTIVGANDPAKNAGVKRVPYSEAIQAATTHQEDFILPYVNDLRNVVDMDAIRAALRAPSCPTSRWASSFPARSATS